MTKLLLFSLTSTVFIGLSSCAYQQTMNERQAENQELRYKLAKEESRGERLRN